MTDQTWLDTLVKITNIFASVATVLAVVVAYFKRNELFRGSIYNKQIDALLDLRQRLHRTWYQIYYSHFWAKNITTLNKSLLEFEKEQPRDWLDHQRFQEDCKFILYTFSSEKNGTLPSWFKPANHKDLVAGVEKLMPFTISALASKSSEEVTSFQNLLTEKIRSIDIAIEKQE